MNCLVFCKSLLLLALVASASAQESATIRIAAKKGTVRASLISGSAVATSVNTPILAGTTLTTGPKSSVDLFLGNQAGTIRLPERSSLEITEFLPGPAGTIEEIQLHLRQGSIIGMGNEMPPTKRYQIKSSHGVADIQAKNFRIGAQGLLVCMDGKILFAYITSEQKVELNILQAPPPQFFFPTQGVAPAPKQLIDEVQAQSSARLN